MWVLEAVPARVVGRISKPEVGPLVDDRGAAREEPRREIRGRPVGEGQEHGIDRWQLVMHGEAGQAEVRMDPGDRVMVALATLQADEVDVRMPGQDPDEFGTDIAGRPDDPASDPSRPPGRVQAALRTGNEP